jgi:hypothetical protein
MYIELMASEQINVPFTLPEMFAGFVAGNGLAKATPTELTLEFVVQDNVLNLLKTGVKEIHIPRSEIDWIQHKRGWFGDKVNVRVKSLRWLADLPGCDNAEVSLRISRRDRARAGELVQILAPA